MYLVELLNDAERQYTMCHFRSSKSGMKKKRTEKDERES